jgi:putative mRNA 3-end processing factor
MNVSYQHANPYDGNESFLLRFEQGMDQTACVLVDAGAGVDVDDLLGDDEHLTTILLTHSHSDHYQSLAANLRDRAPIYTTEATARVLGSVLSEAQQYTDDDFDETDAVLDALEPIDDWKSPVEGLRIAPIPVGHTPGAAGFVLQFEDGDGWESILATGDWTRQRAAGYAGFDTPLSVDVGAIFLTGATNDSYEESLTESVGTVCERAHAGSPVLVSASGLTSVQYAYLLGNLTERLDRPLPVTLAGHAAKLYDDLDYDVPNVETVAEFDDPSELLGPETVTIAGPEVPTEGSSGRLFGEIREDPNATLVQVVAGGDTPIPSARCTTSEFEVVAHPTETEVDTVVEDLDPTQVVVTHQRRGAARRFRDRYDSFVWATSDKDEYVLHEDGEWVAPPWMTAEGISYVHAGNGSGRGALFGGVFNIEDEELPLPSCERVEGDVDLAAEGLDVDALEQQLRLSSTVESEPDEATATEDEPTPTAADVSTSDDGVPTDELPDEESAEPILSRLDAIEAKLGGTTVPARVVDAGDDVTLLRLRGEVDVEHSQMVEVTIRNTDEDGQQS